MTEVVKLFWGYSFSINKSDTLNSIYKAEYFYQYANKLFDPLSPSVRFELWQDEKEVKDKGLITLIRIAIFYLIPFYETNESTPSIKEYIEYLGMHYLIKRIEKREFSILLTVGGKDYYFIMKITDRHDAYSVDNYILRKGYNYKEEAYEYFAWDENKNRILDINKIKQIVKTKENWDYLDSI